MKKLLCLTMVLSLALSCGGDSSSGDGTTSLVSVSGTMGTAKANGEKGISAIDLTALKMYCVAFNASASSGSSDFAADGSFSLNMPANVIFGCFVVQKADSAIVATIKVKDNVNTGMSNEDSNSMSLGSSVNFGSITLTEGSSVVEVDKSIIDTAASTNTTAALSVSDIHGTAWTLTCVDSSDTDCANFVSQSPQVYLRVVSATKNAQTIYGLGVWASQSAFTTCGSVDMTSTEADDIMNSEGGSGVFSWVQNTQGPYDQATSTTSACPLRDVGDTASSDTLEYYYTLSKLVISGNSYGIVDEDAGTSGACSWYYKTAVNFSPKDATTMYGNFEIVESETETSTGACGGGTLPNTKANFIVKFTKQ